MKNRSDLLSSSKQYFGTRKKESLVLYMSVWMVVKVVVVVVVVVVCVCV